MWCPALWLSLVHTLIHPFQLVAFGMPMMWSRGWLRICSSDTGVITVGGVTALPLRITCRRTCWLRKPWLETSSPGWWMCSQWFRSVCILNAFLAPSFRVLHFAMGNTNWCFITTADFRSLRPGLAFALELCKSRKMSSSPSNPTGWLLITTHPGLIEEQLCKLVGWHDQILFAECITIPCVTVGFIPYRIKSDHITSQSRTLVFLDLVFRWNTSKGMASIVRALGYWLFLCHNWRLQEQITSDDHLIA